MSAVESARSQKLSPFTDDERAALSELNLFPFIPSTISGPEVLSERPSGRGFVPPPLGRGGPQIKALCQWLGVPYQRWIDDLWRWCFDLRFHWGDRPAITLLDVKWREQIESMMQQSRINFESARMVHELFQRSDRTASHSLVAVVYADAKDGGALGKDHPLHESLRHSGFWEHLARRWPGEFGSPDLLRYVKVGEGSYESLVGQLVYQVQTLEDGVGGETG